MNMRSPLYIIMIALLIPMVSSARSLSIRVLDRNSGIPLLATVHIECDSTALVDAVSDGDGSLTAQIPDSIGSVLVEISCDGYIPSVLHLTGDNTCELGTVALDKIPNELREVTVVGSSSSLRAGRRTIFPTAQQVKRNYNSAQLITDLQASAPELEVNPILNTISINGQTPVFLINGRRQYTDRLIDLRPDRIERIEMTGYRDPRYDAPVFNIILKQASMGGTASVYTQDAVTTPKAYAKATATYNYKKSEFLFDYRLTYRNSDNEINDVDESFIGPDFILTRTGHGLPSSTIDQDHRFLLEYTLVPGRNTIFVLSGEATLHRNHNHRRTLYSQMDGREGPGEEFESLNNRRYRRTPFGISAFFRHQGAAHTTEMATGMSHAHGEYDRELSYSDGYAAVSHSRNGGLAYNADVNYRLRLPRALTVNAGVGYMYNVAGSDFIQSGYPTEKSTTRSSQISAYGKMSWSNRGFSMSGGPGIRFFSSAYGSVRDNYWRWRGALALNQNMGPALSAGYSVALDPFFPSLGQISAVPQMIDDHSMHMGNPALKPALGITQNLRVSWRLGKLRLSPYVNHGFIRSPILEHWHYDNTERLFVQSYENGAGSHDVTASLKISLSNILGRINATADVGYSRFWMHLKDERLSKGHLFCRLNASAYIGKFNVSMSLLPVRGIQYQGGSYVRETAFNSISAFYRHRNFQIGAQWQNPLTSRACLTQLYHISPVHPQYDEYYIGNFNNMLLLSLQYNVSFGDTYKKSSVQTRKPSVTDIITAY